MTSDEKQEWEYHLLDSSTGVFSNSKISAQVNALGKQGWEAIGIANAGHQVLILFKRRRK
jgi:hypothetical protein